MKICTTKTLNDNVYIASITTSDFSEADKELMNDFGEPTINIGGDYSGDKADSGAGTVDMSAGHDWSSAPEEFDVRVNGGTLITVVLNSSCADVLAVVAEINSAIAAASLGSLIEAYQSSGYVGIRTIHAGEDQELILQSGGDEYADALVTLGLTPATYAGFDAPDFTLTTSLRAIQTGEDPLVQRFDVRDERFAGAAQLSAELWALEIVERIKTAMDNLRDEQDTFSGQYCETY